MCEDDIREVEHACEGRDQESTGSGENEGRCGDDQDVKRSELRIGATSHMNQARHEPEVAQDLPAEERVVQSALKFTPRRRDGGKYAGDNKQDRRNEAVIRFGILEHESDRQKNRKREREANRVLPSKQESRIQHF